MKKREHRLARARCKSTSASLGFSEAQPVVTTPSTSSFALLLPIFPVDNPPSHFLDSAELGEWPGLAE